MFFRSIAVYRITQAIELEAEALEVALRTKPARVPGSQELSTYGFIAPFGKGEHAPLVHASHGYMLIAARKHERNLPGAVVRDALKEKVEQIEADQLRKVYKKERDQIKDDIVMELLPRAFPRKKTTFAAIDLQRGLIIVDSASPKHAEDLLSTLREVLGSLPVRPLTVKVAPSATMTDWIKTQQAAPDFFVLDECKLCDTNEEGGTIAAKRQDLTSEEMQLHLATGKLVTKLSLAWQDKLSFVLDDSLLIKSLRFEDMLHDQAAQDGGDDAIGQLDASFVLMMLTFREFLPALIDALGGEEMPEGLGADGQAGAATWPERELVKFNSPDEFKAMYQGEFSVGEGTAEDPLYAEAVSAVRTELRASISFVQRKLKIGYNRAARMIETMEAAGIVTHMDSNGAREVIA